MGRARFGKGMQRKFFDLVIEKTGAVSLRGLMQFGITANYSTLKNYYGETRLIPEALFEELREISGIGKGELVFEIVKDNWGQVKGGKLGRKS